MLKLKRVVAPIVEPVTLNLIKSQLRIDLEDDSFDEQLAELLPAAREWCEDYQNRAYITQTFELALDCWPNGNGIILPRPLIQNVESVSYKNSEGASTQWAPANYVVDDFSEPSRIIRGRDISWPSANLAATNGIIIRYVAGYGDAPEDVPAKIKQAIILLICFWFENGYCDPPRAVISLLSADRIVPL